jgi:hypothetical protein
MVLKNDVMNARKGFYFFTRVEEDKCSRVPAQCCHHLTAAKQTTTVYFILTLSLTNWLKFSVNFNRQKGSCMLPHA